jgi:hypothetical protein
MLGSGYTSPLSGYSSYRRIRSRVRKMEQEKKPRKTRSDKGRVILNARDLHGLHFVGEQYGASYDQLRYILNRDNPLSLGSVRNVVERWRKQGLIETWRMLNDYEPWVYLTHRGLKELDLPYSLWEPKLSSVPHYYEVNRVRLYVESRGSGKWISERYLRKHHVYSLVIGGREHYPDGLVEVVNRDGQQLHLAIEVERTPKKPQDLYENIVSLIRSKTFSQVYYFINEKTEKGVREVADNLPENERIRLKVVSMEDTPNTRDPAPTT